MKVARWFTLVLLLLGQNIIIAELYQQFLPAGAFLCGVYMTVRMERSGSEVAAGVSLVCVVL